jgi:hypothetical protein
LVQEVGLDTPDLWGSAGYYENTKLSLKINKYPYIYKQNTSFSLYIQTLFDHILDSQIAQFGVWKTGYVGLEVWGILDVVVWDYERPKYGVTITQTNIQTLYYSQIIN